MAHRLAHLLNSMNNEAIDNGKNLSASSSSIEAARELQLVRAGPSQFGIFTEEISAIVPWREPTPLPYAPHSVLGVVSISGWMLTVLDLASLQVSEQSKDEPRTSFWQIVGLRGAEQLALAVDSVDERLEFADSDFHAASAERFILGVLRRNGAEINILNLSELFPAAIQGHERRRREF